MNTLSHLMRNTLTPLILLASAVGSSAQSTLFSETFESGLAGWTTSGYWNPQTDTDTCGAFGAPFPIGQGAAYYGSAVECNFICPTTVPFFTGGSLTRVSPISIPNTPWGVKLHFWSLDITECANCLYDNRFVSASSDGGQTWEVLGASTSFLSWKETVLDLDDYRGEDVLLSFTFESLDCEQNSSLGWLIDDVSIVEECTEPFVYCSSLAVPNSTGQIASIGHSGSTSIAANDFVLTASDTPPGSFGLFFYATGDTITNVGASPFGDGWLCVQGFTATGIAPLIRVPGPLSSDAAGFGSRLFDLTQAPASAGIGQVTGGSSWRFQYWYRDAAAGGAGFNISDALEAQFCP